MRKLKRFLRCIFGYVMLALLLVGCHWLFTGGFSQIAKQDSALGQSVEAMISSDFYQQANERLSQVVDFAWTATRESAWFASLASPDLQKQEELAESTEKAWQRLKTELSTLKEGNASPEQIYALSETQFALADDMLDQAEEIGEQKMQILIGLGITLFLCLLVIYFITSRNYQKTLDESALRDKLTGLFNRAGFECAFEQLRGKKSTENYSIVEFDINQFHNINNRYGYTAGDRILCNIADLLRETLQQDELCGRIDSDRFVFVAKDAPMRIETLQKHLVEAFTDQEQELYVEIPVFAFGGYEITSAKEHVKTMLDKADATHKIAKKSGKTSVLWYNESTFQAIEQENYYKEHIQEGIHNKEFQVYLQPQVDIKNREVFSAEALVRWHLPNGRLIYPDSFIPLFEKTGLIVSLDFYMVEQVCEYLAQCKQNNQPMYHVSVNFSRVTLHQSNFKERLLQIVEKYQIPTEYIVIEILESALNEVDPSILKELVCVHQLGFYIAIDDFGSGYSNLTALAHLPVQILKLDRQFLRANDNNPKIKIIIKSIVDLSHQLNLRVICEGVEHAKDVSFLREIGCEWAQGYFFAKPVPQQEFLDTVAKVDQKWAICD